MRLALQVGRLDVDGVLAELTSRELAEWDAFDRLEGGFGGRAAWGPGALLAALYAESHRDREKRGKPFSQADFLPWLQELRPAMTPAAFRAQFTPLVRKKKGG